MRFVFVGVLLILVSCAIKSTPVFTVESDVNFKFDKSKAIQIVFEDTVGMHADVRKRFDKHLTSEQYLGLLNHSLDSIFNADSIKTTNEKSHFVLSLKAINFSYTTVGRTVRSFLKSDVELSHNGEVIRAFYSSGYGIDS